MEVNENTLHSTDHYHSTGNTSNNTGVIELIDVSEIPENPTCSRRTSNVYDKELCKDSKSLTNFINKCILLDQTIGMEQIINKVLLPNYVKADTKYKQSKEFERVVTKALQRLINNGDKKYTHISDIVDTLKLHAAKVNVNIGNSEPANANTVAKRRVKFVTLSTKVSSEYFAKPNENNRKRHMADNNSQMCPKKSKPDVIVLDIDDDDDDDVIPVDDEGIQDVINNQEMDHSGVAVSDSEVNSETIEIKDSQELTTTEETHNELKTENETYKLNDDKIVSTENGNEQNNESIHRINEIENEKENLETSENLDDGNRLLVPHREKIVRLEKPKSRTQKPEEMTEEAKAKRIKFLEAKIEKLSNAITKLETDEITDYSANSSYCKSSQHKKTIVKLYEELCCLVGDAPPKRHKIRLHQLTEGSEGLPKGPIERLEDFLNKRTDTDGIPAFPDFNDVVRIVEKSNKKDGIGWNKATVMQVAQRLFEVCGRTLQEMRQKREWKYLRMKVRPEEFEADPADNDPELQARLEANSRLAKQREAEVFSKFTRLQNEPQPQATTSLQNEDNLREEDTSEADDSSSDEEPSDPTNRVPTTQVIDPAPGTPALKETNNNTDYPEIDTSIVKQEPMEPIQIQYKGDISLVVEISDSESEEDELGILTF